MMTWDMLEITMDLFIFIQIPMFIGCADKRDGLEFGIYLHDKELTNVYTASHTDYDDQIIASIRWKF